MENLKSLNQLYELSKKNNVINKDKSFATFVKELKELFKKTFNKDADENKEMFITFANNFTENSIFVNELSKNYSSDGDENKKNNTKFNINKLKLLQTLNIISSLMTIGLFTMYSIDKFKNK